MSQAQRDHVKSYRSRLQLHLSQNIGAHTAHKLAADYARWMRPLGEEEQRAVDEWLDGQHPERKEKPRGETPSGFDELPAV